MLRLSGGLLLAAWVCLLSPLAAAQCTFDRTLLAEEFDTFDDTLWTVEGGTWSCQDGYLRQGDTEQQVARVVAGHPDWSNCRIAFSIRCEGDRSNGADHTAGLIFRHQDARNHYELAFYPGSGPGFARNSVKLFKMVEGERIELGGASCDIPEDTQLDMELEICGTSFRLFRSGQLVTTFTDGTFTAGRVGFFSRHFLGPAQARRQTMRFESIEVSGEGSLVLRPDEQISASALLPEGARRPFTVEGGAAPLSWILTGTSPGSNHREVPGTGGRTVEYTAGTAPGVDHLTVTDAQGHASSVTIRVVDPGSATGIQGDVNGDGAVDEADVDAVRSLIPR